MKKLLTLALLACVLSTQVHAQRVELTVDQYLSLIHISEPTRPY